MPQPINMKCGFDIVCIRKDFPILDSIINGKKLVYLDNAATTQKPISVIERMCQFMLHENGTVRRGLYDLSIKSTQAFDEVREKIRQFINAERSEEIIFTRGTTESINLVASSYGQAFLRAGDEIIISEIEHHANIVPWQLLRDKIGIKLKIIPVDDNGELELNEYKELLGSPQAKFVAITHVSNALGTVNPVKEMIYEAHKHKIPVLVDGAQAVQHQRIDVQNLDADFYVFSGHKLYGPTGIGVLYGKKKYLDQMPPYHGGGEMIEKVTFEKTTFASIPYKFEAGTPPIIEVIGLGEAIDYVNKIGMDKISEYEKELLRYATEKALSIEGLRIIGTAKHKASIISMVFDCAEAFDIGTLLNEHGIAIRVGHHCAQPLMDRFGVSSTARMSLAFYNTQDDIDRFFVALEQVLGMF